MKITEDIKLDFDDVLIRPKRSDIVSRAEVTIERSFTTKHSKKIISGFPLIVSNMDSVGTFAMVKALKNTALVALHKHYSIEEIVKFHNEYKGINYFFSFGQSDKDLEKMHSLHSQICLDAILLDVANGYTQAFVKHVEIIRGLFPKSIIMAGNVCTPEMTEQLIISGADIVKIGIGPGSVCTTRLKTGVGYGQLSAILECKDAAHGLGGLICGDGGIRNAGDAAKAFGAGADFIMTGGMFAGCDECEGEWNIDDSKSYSFIVGYKDMILSTSEAIQKGIKIKPDINRQVWIKEPIYQKEGCKKISLNFYGMSSKEAQEKYNGGVAQHRAAEGKCVTIPYKGFANDVILDIQGGVRSACAYVGARRLKDFDKCCSFVKINRTHNTIYGD